ncbi:MAG: UDP-N-acetylmuramoyl-L-alanyl-D-glutamate--2,6-diaminopimelate ligase [Chlamydiae bacterium]|nr:UDP-N-acetylmuramoyl-L-alanyl-D-glutamate--2,6-diaminopimelate ligase [Chlamydiota bacterium]
MKLRQLIRDLRLSIKGRLEIDISGLSNHSKRAAPGNVFIAKKGARLDGSSFIQEAVLAGASAVVSDLYDPFLSVTQIIHPNPASLEPLLAARFYGHPSSDLFVCGVTGTKGKTTTTYLIKQLLDTLGFSAGLIGSVETCAGAHRFFSTLTTHDAIFNQKWLREMQIAKCKAASLEVSSHGLMQDRVKGIDLDAAIFTNLSRDHLDYHETIEAYAKAKKQLFSQLDESGKKKKRALFNADSPWSAFMQSGLRTPFWTFGCDASADIRASDCVFSQTQMQCKVHFQGKSILFTAPLMGAFNLHNLIAAIGASLHAGFSLEDLESAARSLKGAPGRLEKVGSQVFVDYAHTGDSLDHALRALKALHPRQLWVVFGCGGDRDPNRRWEMAKAAEAQADRIIITSDNPRSEPPEEIARQILSGFRSTKNVQVELDRREAILCAIRQLKEGDLLLIAGKGHEKTQVFAHQTVPFDDVEIAREGLD